MKVSNERLALAMTMIVAVVSGGPWTSSNLATAAIGQASAAEEPAQATTLEQYCRNWARNGVMGAKVHHRNGPRKITYIDDIQLRYLLKHQVAGDNLYLLKGEYTPEETRYLEESLLAGYDRLDPWIREHGTETPDFALWEEEFFGTCMKDVPQAVQVLRAAQ